MKKHIALMLCLMTSPIIFAQTKVAHVSTKALLDTLPSRKNAMMEIQHITKRSEAELIELDKQLEKSYNDYLAKKGTQSETVNQYEEKRLQKMQQDLQQREQELNTDIQQMTATANDRTIKVVKEAIKIVADKKNIQYVIDQDGTLYANGTDITLDVIAELLRLDAIAINK